MKITKETVEIKENTEIKSLFEYAVKKGYKNTEDLYKGLKGYRVRTIKSATNSGHTLGLGKEYEVVVGMPKAKTSLSRTTRFDCSYLKSIDDGLVMVNRGYIYPCELEVLGDSVDMLENRLKKLTEEYNKEKNIIINKLEFLKKYNLEEMDPQIMKILPLLEELNEKSSFEETLRVANKILEIQ